RALFKQYFVLGFLDLKFHPVFGVKVPAKNPGLIAGSSAEHHTSFNRANQTARKRGGDRNRLLASRRSSQCAPAFRPSRLFIRPSWIQKTIVEIVAEQTGRRTGTKFVRSNVIGCSLGSRLSVKIVAYGGQRGSLIDRRSSG